MATPIQVVFDCADPDAQARFWAEALHYVLQPPPPGFDSWDAWADSMGIPPEQRNDFSAALDPDGVGPRLFFQRVPEGKVAKNRVHLDVNAGGGRNVPDDERRRRVDAEVARLKALGASDERGAMDRHGEYWVRMNDPEGNEFCVQ
ncbi:MAG: VOC family protein [Chloroflexi bacterium]|jgi:hypothetical protein|nr:VOC family protein [Chloroflexota bacterium]